MGELRLNIIPREEWDRVKELSVRPEQSHFIEASAQCLQDAKNDAYNMKWTFYGIYVNDELIGFAMHGETRLLFYRRVWLDRFMIDHKHQGKGYGKKSMKLILDKMHEAYRCKKIYLSVHEDNDNAIRLYEQVAFKKTLFKDPKGERIMTRTKQDSIGRTR